MGRTTYIYGVGLILSRAVEGWACSGWFEQPWFEVAEPVKMFAAVSQDDVFLVYGAASPCHG